jgi:DNA invertase Pin-like site-specific DNA recombinase
VREVSSDADPTAGRLAYSEVVYRPQSSDTSEAVDRMMMQAYGRMSPAEKMDRVRALCRAAHRAAAAGIRLQKPDATDEEIRIIVAARRLGEELVQRVLARRRSSHGLG